MVETGSPFDIKQLYEAGLPTYQRGLEQAIAQAKEQAGVRGGLRSRAGWETLGEAATSAAERWGQYLAEQGMRAHEAAAARQLQAIAPAMQIAAYPLERARELAQLGALLEAGRYPLLEAAMRMALTGVGQAHEQTQYQPTFSMGCCFIFIEGEGHIADVVRRYRDDHYGKSSSVSRGYKRMASWLVPIMRRVPFVKWLIKITMTRPLFKYAEWAYGENSYGWIFAPFKWFWVNLWRIYGKLTRVDIAKEPRP